MLKVKITYKAPGLRGSGPEYLTPISKVPCYFVFRDESGVLYYGTEDLALKVNGQWMRPVFSLPFWRTAREGMTALISFTVIDGEKIVTAASLVGVQEEV